MARYLRRLLGQEIHDELIEDKFTSIEDVHRALEKCGLTQVKAIIGVDYSKSNESTGEKTFGGRSLHEISPDEAVWNPYQRVISLLGSALEAFNVNPLIPAFGFGDATTTDKSIFPFYKNSFCNTFRNVLDRYNEITPTIKLSGPTNFTPIIKKSIELVKESGGLYHILIIITDGQVVNQKGTREAIVEASHYPLSILAVGVGDGPWDLQNEFDDQLPQRLFDNYQFINFSDITSKGHKNPDVYFALNALMEIPDQYARIKQLGLLDPEKIGPKASRSQQREKSPLPQ